MQHGRAEVHTELTRDLNRFPQGLLDLGHRLPSRLELALIKRLAQSGELLLEPLRREVAGALTFQRPPTIARAALGDRAGCLGAACLAWDLT